MQGHSQPHVERNVPATQDEPEQHKLHREKIGETEKASGEI